MSRLSRFIGIVTCCFALVGCSFSEPDNPPTSGEPVELLLYTTSVDLNRDALDAAIQVYTKKHPNVTLRVKELPYEQFYTASGQLKVAATQGGDILFLGDSAMKELWAAGGLRDLSHVVLPRFNETVSHLIDPMTNVDGSRVGIPIYISPAVFTVNAEKLKEAGLDLPPVDWTVDDWDQVQKDLRAGGGSTVAMASAVLEPMVYAFGGQVYDSAKDRWVFDSPEALQGLAWVAHQVQSKSIQVSPPGNRIIVLGGKDAPAFAAAPPGRNLPLGTTIQPFPKGPKGRFAPAAALLAGVLASSNHPEIAMDFLREMMHNTEAQEGMARTGIRPLTADKKALAAWKQVVGDRASAALELSLKGAYAVEPISRRDFLEGITPYLEGRSTLEETVPSLLSRLNAR